MARATTDPFGVIDPHRLHQASFSTLGRERSLPRRSQRRSRADLAGNTRPRSPRTTPLYRDVEALYDEVNGLWEERFEGRYGFWRGFVDKQVRRYLDCGLFENGFARVRCPDCRTEYLLAFSCKTRQLRPLTMTSTPFSRATKNSPATIYTVLWRQGCRRSFVILRGRTKRNVGLRKRPLQRQSDEVF